MLALVPWGWIFLGSTIALCEAIPTIWVWRATGNVFGFIFAISALGWLTYFLLLPLAIGYVFAMGMPLGSAINLSCWQGVFAPH